MKLAWFFLWTGGAWLMGGVIQPPTLVTTEVSFGTRGPYRFLVDTGAQSSTMDAQLALELGIQPQFRVELVNVHGARLVPGARVHELRLGARKVSEVEVMIDDPKGARQLDGTVRGVIGMNVLSLLDYGLDTKAGRLDVGIRRPEGETVPFAWLDGRMVVKGRMGRELLSFVLDSGASHVVLFHTPVAMAKTKPMAVQVQTLDSVSSVAPTSWTADIVFTDRLRVGTLPAAILQGGERKVDGLFPMSAFSTVFIDHARRELVVSRR